MTGHTNLSNQTNNIPRPYMSLPRLTWEDLEDEYTQYENQVDESHALDGSIPEDLNIESEIPQRIVVYIYEDSYY